jgi:haloacid dehalogenase-like hydrolase
MRSEPKGMRKVVFQEGGPRLHERVDAKIKSMKPMRDALVLLVFASLTTSRAQDPLPSWNEGPAKRSIIEFVAKVAKEGTPDFVPLAERIATFDNDGTLWCEQPLYTQIFFALDRVKVLAPQHPKWKDKEPFASLLKGDTKAAHAGGERGIIEIIAATHAGMTTTEFDQTVKDWIATAKNPKTGRLFTEMVYQPMLELLAYLRAHGFKTFSDALLAAAQEKEWTVISMKDDWKTIFPPKP